MTTTLKSMLAALALLTATLPLCSCDSSAATGPPPATSDAKAQEATKEQAMLVQYLEIVTSDVDATCRVLAQVHGVTFGAPDAGLANARTASLEGGGRIGVRAPMAEQDMEIVRPYVLVADIEAAVKAAEEAGAQVAMGATEMPGGHGKFAIYFQGGQQFGLWEAPSSKAPHPTAGAQEATKKQALLVQYLEVVTADVDATCSVLSKVHGVTFGAPDAGLANARTTPLEGGGRIGVRAPMAEQDMQIVRPYALVADIEAAVKIAEQAGAQVAMGATEMPGGHGKFAIYFQAGRQLGLWETSSSKDHSR